jgi:NADH-quinone oxidoreductase subunit E
MDDAKLDKILTDHERDPAALLAILMDIQAEENYLPKDDLKKVAEELGVSFAKIYSMATFFSAFSLKPRGKHICTVCMGTACHVRGAPKLVEQVQRQFDLQGTDTTEDMFLTVETVNCVGACALGPLVILDGEYHGNIKPNKLEKVLKKLEKNRDE